jgi:hypothetical protein
MRILSRILGRRSFVPLREHTAAVEAAAEELDRGLRAWLRGEAVDADLVSEREHQADVVKRDLRAHLSKTSWLPVQRASLLELIWHQDEIADLCQDSALLMRLRRPKLGIELEDGFRTLGEALVRVIHEYHLAIEAFEEALRAGLSQKSKALVLEEVERINKLEHESDLLERQIVEAIYQAEDLSDFDRYHLVQLVLMLGGVVDQAENAAGDLRVMALG